jgi:DNA-binding response OmpR family regulator
VNALMIDDDEQSIKDVAFCLQVRYPDTNIITVSEGRRGIELVGIESPDIVLIGSSLPDISTVELIRGIRRNSDVGLIVLAEKQTDLERAEELEIGADEYVIKPFSPIEFLAKINALLRRINGLGFKTRHVVTIGNELVINFNTREVFHSGERVNLTPLEYQLLAELVKNEGRVLTHGTIMEKVWGAEYVDDPSFVKKYVYRLRTKIETDASNPRMIINERGVGYRFAKIV